MFIVCFTLSLAPRDRTLPVVWSQQGDGVYSRQTLRLIWCNGITTQVASSSWSADETVRYTLRLAGRGWCSGRIDAAVFKTPWLQPALQRQQYLSGPLWWRAVRAGHCVTCTASQRIRPLDYSTFPSYQLTSLETLLRVFSAIDEHCQMLDIIKAFTVLTELVVLFTSDHVIRYSIRDWRRYCIMGNSAFSRISRYNTITVY